MRNQLRRMWMVVLFLCVMGAMMVGDPEVSAKSKVSFQVKGTTLIVSGKGKMPGTGTVKNPEKIKKVVIKKGVTSISDFAFEDWKSLKVVKIPNTVKKIEYFAFSRSGIESITIPKSVKVMYEGVFASCKKLKKVTMPGKMKFIEWVDDMAKLVWDYNSNIHTITFSTQLNLDTLAYIDSKNLVVSKKDKKYKSIDGMIYSKDGKKIVRIPALRKKAVIAKGCKEFYLQSVVWSGEDWSGDPNGGCCKLKKIIIPKSVNIIEDKKYFAFHQVDESWWDDGEIQVKIANKSTSYEQLELLHKRLGISYENLWKEVPDAFGSSGVSGMCVSKAGELKWYGGKAKSVNIPESVNKVCEYAFAGNTSVEEVIVPKTVTEIENCAFEKCENLKKLQLTDGLTTVGRGIVVCCNKLEELVIPGTVHSMESMAFAQCGIKNLVV